MLRRNVLLASLVLALAVGLVPVQDARANGCEVHTSLTTIGNLTVMGLVFCDANAAQWVSLATNISGEDSSATGGGSTTGLLVTEHRYLNSGPKTADVQIKAGSGFLHTVTCNSDAAATAGSLIIYDSLTETGTKIHQIDLGTGFYPPATLIFDTPFATGLYLGFTTTADYTCTVSYR